MSSSLANGESVDAKDPQVGMNGGDSTVAAVKDAQFIESLSEDLQAIAKTTLDGTKGDNSGGDDASIRLERLEVQLRQQVLRRIRELSASPSATTTTSATTDMGQFWTDALHLCLHFVYMSEESENEQYKGLNARKIPFVLLEDIFDCLAVGQCWAFWRDVVLKAYPTIFGPRIWTPSPSEHPCWLPFLKITNKLIRRLPPKESADIMLTLCRVYPLAERSGARPFGSHNAENITSFESVTEYEEEQAQIPMEIKMDEEGSVSDYNFYESFWKLQEDLNNPNGVDVAGFLQRLKNMITALESHKVAIASEAPHRVAHSEGVKYLTGSHLLPYQLTNPEFRIHILAQILIVLHYLLSAAGPTFRTQLVDWQNRFRLLFKSSGKYGPKHLALLESILNGHEGAWRAWKKGKFQEDLDKKQSVPLTSKRRRRTLGGALGTPNTEDEGSMVFTQGMLNPTELATVSKKMRSSVPSMDTHLAEYIEALDPEAGIEAEYHPKNDKLFAWRALRVMTRDHLGQMQRVHVNGDFEGMVRHIYKEQRDMDIPGECPEYVEEDFEEKEEEEEEIVQEHNDEEKLEPESEPAEDEHMEDITDDVTPGTGEKQTDEKAEEVEEVAVEEKVTKVTSYSDMAIAKMEIVDEAVEESDAAKSSTEVPHSSEKPESLSISESGKEVTETPTAEPLKDEAAKVANERPKLDFIPPPKKETKPDTADQLPQENGQRRRGEDGMDTSGGRRGRGGQGRGEPRGRGSNERGRNPPSRSDRGPPPGRDDRRNISRDDRRSPGTGRDDRSSPHGKSDRVPPGKGDRASPPRRDDRGPPRREDHWVPPPGRGHGRDDHRRGGGGGRGGSGGRRGDDRGPPSERWDDQRRRRDDHGDDRRDSDDRRGPRRRHRN